MKIFGGYALVTSIAAALLAACGGAQPPIGAPGAMPPSSIYSQISTGQSAPRLSRGVHFAYVPNLYSDDVTAYAINANSGALKHVKGSPFAAGSQPWAVAIDPTGKFTYVTNYHSDNVCAYAINASTGALTQVQGSPFAAGAYSYEVAIDSTGKFAYVTNGYVSGRGNVVAFAIHASSGALTQVPGSPFAAGYFPFGLATAPTGNFLYVVNAGSNNVSTYAINATSGALTHVKDSKTGSSPYGVAIDPTGKFAYVTNYDSKNVSGYGIDASNGTFKGLKGSPFKADRGPSNVAIR